LLFYPLSKKTLLFGINGTQQVNQTAVKNTTTTTTTITNNNKTEQNYNSNNKSLSTAGQLHISTMRMLWLHSKLRSGVRHA